MIRVGIELNGVIRDINKQYLKYYTKDINPTFDDTKLDINVNNLIDTLEFESKSAKKKFIFEDYPYELFGCASPMSRNLHTFLNGWIYNMYWHNDFDISTFSLGEDELTIQSTYFYLSKSGSRMRKVIFPLTESEVWENYDVIITCNPKLIYEQPSNKISVLIKKADNMVVQDEADYVYGTLEDVIKDENFAMTISLNKKLNQNNNLINRIYNKIKNFFKKHGK